MSQTIPSYLTDQLLWLQVGSIVLAALALAALAAAIMRPKGSHFMDAFVPLAAMSTLGFVVGALTGQSRAAAVGEVLPAVLTFLGGVLVYLLGTKGAREQRFVATTVLLFAIALIVGTNWGASIRAYDETVGLVRRQQQVCQLQKALELPAPCTAGTPKSDAGN